MYLLGMGNYRSGRIIEDGVGDRQLMFPTAMLAQYYKEKAIEFDEWDGEADAKIAEWAEKDEAV